MQVSAILALQSVVGLLRLATPSLVALLGTKRRTCLTMSLASYVLIAVLPVIPWLGVRVEVVRPVEMLIALLCAHQLLEYVGAVALWSWFGDLVPRRIRGRFFARRNLIQLLLVMIVTPASGWLIDQWQRSHPSADDKLLGYSIATAIGAAALLASLVPLVMTPAVVRGRLDADIQRRHLARSRGGLTSELIAPLFDPAYRRLLLFMLWFSLANGVTQAAQSLFPKMILQLSLTMSLAMVTMMRVGQAAVCLPLGRWSDRLGNRPLLVVCQVLIASGLLFYAVASPERPEWLWGAWVLWIAFAGHNLCLNNLMLKLAPRGDNTAHVATFFAVSNLALACSTLAGGWLLGAGQAAIRDQRLSITEPQLFSLVFALGWGLRTAGAALAARLIEPGAASWRDLMSRPVGQTAGDAASG